MKKFLFISILLISQSLFVKFSYAYANDYIGIYIAPRLGFHYTNTFSIKLDDVNNFIALNNYDNFIIRGGLGIGYDYNKKFNIPLRHEIEFIAYSQMNDTQDINSTNINGKINISNSVYVLFTNIYYDFYNTTKFIPYMGLGGGIYFSKLHGDFNLQKLQGTNITDNFPVTNTSNFGINSSLGISYPINKYINIDAMYRITYYNDIKTKYKNQLSLAANTIMNQIFLLARITF